MEKMAFKQIIVELEHIASGDCQCTEDGCDVCRACKASRTLNRIYSDVFDDLEELKL